MKFKKLAAFLFTYGILLFLQDSFLYSYLSNLNIMNRKIQISSSSPKIWSKISDSYYSSYLYRLEDRNNVIEIISNHNKFNHIEFYYNIYYKSDQKIPSSFTNDIIVLIDEDRKSFRRLYLDQVNRLGQNKIKLDISKWRDKKIKFKIVVKQNELIGTEIFGIYFFNLKEQPKRVMLISLDCVGSKHMSLYGYEKFNTTPRINEIVKKENNILVFSNAYGQSRWTLPAHASMFSGLYPSQHDMNIGDRRIIFNGKIKLLHQIIQENGIYTYHSISHSRIAAKYGYNRGVILYSDHSNLKDGEKADNTIQYAINVIKENLDKDLFLFLHFFDAHMPYTEYPKNYKKLSADIRPMIGSKFMKKVGGKTTTIMNNMNWYDPRNRLINKQKYKNESEKIIKNIERAYDLGLYVLDQKIYTFFNQIKYLNLWDSFDIFILGDHGEEFFEHAGMTHTSLYNDNLRVPIIIKLSETNDKKLNLNKNKFINTNIEAHIATFWTILDMFNLNNNVYLKRTTIKNYSLLNKSFNNGGIFSELFPSSSDTDSNDNPYLFYQAALILDNFKLILATYLKKIDSFQLNNEYYELFNILKDPEEKYNLINNKNYKKVAKNLKKRLIKRIKREWKNKFEAIKKGQLSKEEIEKLKALGYIK